MTSDDTFLRRPRWYAAAIVGSIVVLALLGVTAAFVDSNVADTVLGLFTGMIAALLVALVLWTEFVRGWMARRRDTAALNDLEPLRAASDADRPAPHRLATHPLAAPSDDRLNPPTDDRPIDR